VKDDEGGMRIDTFFTIKELHIRLLVYR